MLLQILAACPAPAAPQWNTFLPIAFSSGSAFAKAASAPPAMKVSVPALAPPVPPETGASTDRQPCASARAWALRALSTSTVEESISSVPAGSAAASCVQTSTTCRPAGSMVMTTSAPSAAARAEPATVIPSARAASSEAGTRSKPRTVWPAFTRLAAMGPPMLPRPMNPMVCAIPSSLSCLSPVPPSPSS